jgi:hypothetical protein
LSGRGRDATSYCFYLLFDDRVRSSIDIIVAAGFVLEMAGLGHHTLQI